MRYVCLIVAILTSGVRAQDAPLNMQQVMDSLYADLRGQAALEGHVDPLGMPVRPVHPLDIVRSMANPITFAARAAPPARAEATSVAALQHKVPKQARKANERGVKLAEKGEHAKAMAQFEEAVAIDPEFADAHSNVGAEHFLGGRMEESVREFQRAVELNPALAITYVNLAAAELALGKAQEARAHVRRGISLGDTSAEAHRVLQAIGR